MDGGGAQQAPIIMSMVEIEQPGLVSRPCGVAMDPTGCFIKAASGPAASAPIPSDDRRLVPFLGSCEYEKSRRRAGPGF